MAKPLVACAADAQPANQISQAQPLNCAEKWICSLEAPEKSWSRCGSQAARIQREPDQNNKKNEKFQEKPENSAQGKHQRRANGRSKPAITSTTLHGFHIIFSSGCTFTSLHILQRESERKSYCQRFLPLFEKPPAGARRVRRAESIKRLGSPGDRGKDPHLGREPVVGF